MPTLIEQLNSVFAAPIPWFIALVAIAVVMWRVFEWAYRSLLNKRKELYELSRSEVDYWKEIAERTTIDATQQIELLKKDRNLTAEAKTQLDQLTETTSHLTTQLNLLGQANSSATGPTGPVGNADVRRTRGSLPWATPWSLPRRAPDMTVHRPSQTDAPKPPDGPTGLRR